MIVAETERLILRTHEARDEERFVAMQTDSRVRRFAGGAAWSPERARMRFQTEYLGQPASMDGLWAVILKRDNNYIGHCGICAREQATEMRLAYYLAQPHWGFGYATEASAAFLEPAFKTLGLERLVADLQDGNQASVRVLEKLGFVFHRSSQLHGRVYHEYELTKQLWSRKNKQGKS